MDQKRSFLHADPGSHSGSSRLVQMGGRRARGGHNPHMGAPFGPYLLWIALSHLLVPCLPEDLRVQWVLTEPDRITLLAEPKSSASLCPLCGHSSERVH